MIIEGIDQQTYNDILHKDIKILFGISWLDPDDNTPYTKTGWGNKDNDHYDILFSKYNIPKNNISWRYIPETNTCYWWDVPGISIKHEVLDILERKYGYKNIRHKKIASDKPEHVSVHASHGLVWNPATRPTFKQWHKYHTSKEDGIPSYTREGD